MRALSALVLLAAITFAQAPTPQQLFEKAFNAQQHGDFPAAIEAYRELLKLRPDLVDARANLGAALSHLGRYDEAIQQYLAALKRGENAAIRLNLALAYYKKSDLADAAAEFTLLHQADPGDARVATLLGDSFSRLGRHDDAIAVLAPLEKTRPDDLDVAYIFGKALIRAGHKRDGVERIEKVAQRGNSADAYLYAGETLFSLSDFELARRDIDAAMRLNPKLPTLYTLTGMILENIGDRKGAATALERALQADPNDFRAHLYLGAVRYFERDLPAAKQHLDRALQIDASSTLARYELSLVERANGDLEAAGKDLEKVVHDDPDWLQPHIELAAMYYRLHRPDDGARERKIVDRLSEEQQRHESKTSTKAPVP